MHLTPPHRRKSADLIPINEIDPAKLWSWRYEPSENDIADTQPFPLISEYQPPHRSGPRWSHRSWRRGAVIAASIVAAAFLLGSGAVAGWLGHPSSTTPPGASNTATQTDATSSPATSAAQPPSHGDPPVPGRAHPPAPALRPGVARPR